MLLDGSAAESDKSEQNAKLAVTGFAQRGLLSRANSMGQPSGGKGEKVPDDIEGGAPGFFKFKSEMFQRATRKLSLWDRKRTAVSLLIQRRWRQRQAGRKERMEFREGGDDAQEGTSGKMVSQGENLKKWNRVEAQWCGPQSLISKTVRAPAFFGESCLWAGLPDAWKAAE